MTPNSFSLHPSSSRLASVAIQFPFIFESKKTPRKKITPPVRAPPGAQYTESWSSFIVLLSVIRAFDLFALMTQ